MAEQHPAPVETITPNSQVQDNQPPPKAATAPAPQLLAERSEPGPAVSIVRAPASEATSYSMLFLLGGLAGVPVGAWLLTHLPSGIYRSVLGILLIAYGSWLLLKRPTRPLRWGAWADLCAAFLGGLTGGLAGFPGASVTIWCGLKGWDKAHQRGVYQPFILCMQPVSLLAIQLMQPATGRAPLDWQTLAFIPAALAGAWFGLRIFKRLSDRQFELAVNLLLVISGISLAL
jgi:uncharacterized membrane protein YfcA